MLAVTHVVATLLLIELLHLDRLEAQVAFVFGVLIDLDHVFGAVQYARTNSWWTFLDPEALYNADVTWKSLAHKPFAIAIIAPLAMGWRLLIPLLFWGVHVAMDFVQESYLGLVSPVELVLLLLATMALLHLRWNRSEERISGRHFVHYLASEMRLVRRLFSPSIWKERRSSRLDS